MQIIEIIQVGGLEGYSIRLSNKNKYYLYSSDAVCVSKGKDTIDEVRSIIRCQDPTLYSLEEEAKEEAKKLIEEYRLLVPIEFGGMNIELAKQCAFISVNKILSVLYERDNLYYHYLLVKDEIEKYEA